MNKKHITKELLNKLYIDEKKSCRQIAKEINVSSKQISRYLKKFGIKTRAFSTKGLKIRTGIVLSEETKEKIRLKHIGKKLSSAHRLKVIKTLKHGLNGKDNPNWKGGKYIRNKGYIYIRIPNNPMTLSNGYVAEHRYVISENIGRPLGRFEHVHHINGIKDDNRLENLELLNGHTHSLITRMETRIRELEEENKELRAFLGNEKK